MAPWLSALSFSGFASRQGRNCRAPLGMVCLLLCNYCGPAPSFLENGKVMQCRKISNNLYFSASFFCLPRCWRYRYTGELFLNSTHQESPRPDNFFRSLFLCNRNCLQFMIKWFASSRNWLDTIGNMSFTVGVVRF